MCITSNTLTNWFFFLDKSKIVMYNVFILTERKVNFMRTTYTRPYNKPMYNKISQSKEFACTAV